MWRDWNKLKCVQVHTKLVMKKWMKTSCWNGKWLKKLKLNHDQQIMSYLQLMNLRNLKWNSAEQYNTC